MARAYVNLDNISSFRSSIEIEADSLNNIEKGFEGKIHESQDSINREKEQVNDVLSRCASSIAQVENKLYDLNNKLQSLQAELAATPPYILVTYTDSEGNSWTVEEPNPAYEALEAEIADVSAEIDALEDVLAMLHEIQESANKQLVMLNKAYQELQNLRQDLNGHFSQLQEAADEATRKLKNIFFVLSDYKNTKLGAPSISKPAMYKPLVSTFNKRAAKLEKQPSKKQDVRPINIQQRVAQCNPHRHKKMFEYNTNSQRAVPAYEMICRGKDVVAKPRVQENDLLSLSPFSVWKNYQQFSAKSMEDIENNMKNWGDKCRVQVILEWVCGDKLGHTFIAEKENGQVRYVDPATGETDCAIYFKYAKPGSIKFCRIDQLETTQLIDECMEEQ